MKKRESSFINNFKKTYSIEEISNYINVVKDLNILVIGETIIDEYQYGQTLGKAGKYPIIAFQNEKLERYDGGILAIYNHLNDFCKVEYYTEDIAIVKKRYIENGQKLFETYSKKESDIECFVTDNFYKGFKDYDLVIVADFGHGMFTKELRQGIQNNANYIALNTQCNAGNMGLNTINKYSRWNYISIDEHELRLATSNQFDCIEEILLNRFTEGIVTITKGEKGCTVFNNGEIKNIPFLKTPEKVIDSIGAGDALFSISSLIAYQNAPPEVIGFIGNLAGNIACSYPGNKYHVTKNRLLNNIKGIYD